MSKCKGSPVSPIHYCTVTLWVFVETVETHVSCEETGQKCAFTFPG